MNWFFDFPSLLPVVLVWIALPDGETMCNDAQIQSCRSAAVSGKLASLPSSGNCIVKQYVDYTHLCTVSNYMRTVDNCCCVHAQRVLCCRYHQNWDHFRCSDTLDTIHTLSDSAITVPLEILLPAILVPTAVLVCCVICCVKCWCYGYDDKDEGVCCTLCKSSDARENTTDSQLSCQQCKARTMHDDYSPIGYNVTPSACVPKLNGFLLQMSPLCRRCECPEPLPPTAPPLEDYSHAINPSNSQSKELDGPPYIYIDTLAMATKRCSSHMNDDNGWVYKALDKNELTGLNLDKPSCPFCYPDSPPPYKEILPMPSTMQS